MGLVTEDKKEAERLTNHQQLKVAAVKARQSISREENIAFAKCYGHGFQSSGSHGGIKNLN